MRKRLFWLVICLVLTRPALAQYGNTYTQPKAGAPTGSCNFNQLISNTTGGTLYYCNALTHTWVQLLSSASTHALLSATHSDTTAAAAARGDMIAAIGAGALWTKVAHSAAAGGYWKWNGTDVVASTGAASGTGSCTNQFVNATNADAAPTCASVALATDVSGILGSANGGTGNGFTKFTGPTTAEKTFTLPDASATVLTTETTGDFVSKLSSIAIGTNPAQSGVIRGSNNVNLIVARNQANSGDIGLLALTTSNYVSIRGAVSVSATFLSPAAAAGITLGSAALPFSDGYFAGTSLTPATNHFKFTGASTLGEDVITWPDILAMTPVVTAASADLTAQTAAIGATTIYAVPATGAGMYRVTWNAKVTTAGTTSSTLGGAGGFQVTYTDADDSVTLTPLAVPNATATGNTTATQLSGVVIVNAKASTNIQYQFGYTDGGGATPMAYSLHVKVEKL